MKQQFKVGQVVKLKPHHCWCDRIHYLLAEGKEIKAVVYAAHEDGSCEINHIRPTGDGVLYTGKHELDQGTTDIATDMIEAV